jgi:hypothetical protein
VLDLLGDEEFRDFDAFDDKSGGHGVTRRP